MVKPVPNRFNPDVLARDGVRYQVQVPLAQFTRLVPLLSAETGARSSTGDARSASGEMAGQVEATFTFSRRQKHVAVVGRLDTVLPLVCQRCLSPMRLPISAAFELVFVGSEAEAQRMPDELDPVVLDENGQISVVDLFEDELLLHVPTVPRHTDDADCDPVGLQRWQVLQPSPSEQPARRNPFDVLKDLDV